MVTWQSLPEELQLRDADLRSLSMQDVEVLFNIATRKGVVDQFASLFWPAMDRARNNESIASIQRCVEFLEERKRTLGRTYDKERAKNYSSYWLARYIALRYNECEYNIRWLTEQYRCARKSQPHLLEV